MDDKYIQQDHPDQKVAFEIAFTVQACVCFAFTAVALMAVPVFVLVYDKPQILVPGLLLAAALPLIALQTPMWVFYRRMKFRRQRLLQSVNPVITFVVIVGLAVAGAGFWSLVIGFWSAPLSPRQSRCGFRHTRFDSGSSVMRSGSIDFSWPLFISSVSLVVSFQIPPAIAPRSLGSAAVGRLPWRRFTQYTTRADDVVTNALYPAICAVKDRRDLLFSPFRSRTAWRCSGACHLGSLSRCLRAGQFTSSWVLGGFPVPVVQVLGICGALDQIGLNLGRIRPRAWRNADIATRCHRLRRRMLVVVLPILSVDGLQGFALGIAAGRTGTVLVRVHYLSRLFPGCRITRST